MFSTNPDEELINAAANGDIETIELCLINGANIRAENARGATALHLAAMGGHTDSVKYLLLKKGIDMTAKDEGRRTALHWAAARGHTDIVKCLLEKGADITAKDKGKMTALHVAVVGNYIDIVKCLLDKGADITAKSGFRLTARSGRRTTLHLAVLGGHADIAKLLLQHNAGLLNIDEHIVKLLKLLNSPQLNSMQTNDIKLLCPHPNNAEYWITTPMELEALSPADKLALAYKWPHGSARSDKIPPSIKILTKGIMLNRKATRPAAECCALFRKLEQLFEEKPTLRQKALDALSNEKEKTEYETVLFAFDVFKNILPTLQLQICMKATGTSQAPTDNEINRAIARLSLNQ